MDRSTLAPVAAMCAEACLHGLRTVTIQLGSVRPVGFPRGELLSIGTNGSHHYAFDSVWVLAWIRNAMRETQ